MAVAAAVQSSGKVVIKGIGLLLSGDIDRPILDADTIVIDDGRIVAVGKEKDCDTGAPAQVIDCRGTAVAPGLIDSHVHPVFGDWTPRQNQLGWIESCLHGGVTTMVSAGEVHLPGRPKDIVGRQGAGNHRPARVRRHACGGRRRRRQGQGRRAGARAGHDRAGLRRPGRRPASSCSARSGWGRSRRARRRRGWSAWARKHGIQSTIHTGGPSIPGSGLIDEDVVLEADADVIGHVNGGHTSLSYKAVCKLCEKSSRALEIVHNGNERIAILTARHAIELKCPHRVILGTDSPAGSGVQPLGILRLIALISSLADVPAEIVFGFATGNTARMRDLARAGGSGGRRTSCSWTRRSTRRQGSLESVQLGDIPASAW